MEGKLTTATGKEFTVDVFETVYDENYMYICILNEDFREMFEVFYDENETNGITFRGKVFSEYTYLDYILRTKNKVKVRLSKNG